MSHSVKDFTASKLSKMKDSGNMMSRKGINDSSARADDFGMTAAGDSNSSIKFKRGGAVHGEAAKRRLDRPMRMKRANGGDTPADRNDTFPEGVRMKRARGGKVGKGKTQINIIVGAGDKGQQPPPAVPVPVPALGGGMPPQMPPPRPPMPMMPPGGAPGMPPGGMPPPGLMGRKRGGAVYEERYGSGGGNARHEKAKVATAKGGAGLIP